MNLFDVSRYGVRGCYRHLCYLASLLDRCERQASPQNRTRVPLHLPRVIGIHCKDTIPKIRNKYSQKSNCASWPNVHIHVSDPTIGLPILLQENTYVDRSWEYINRSRTRECGNWDWGRAIPIMGIHKWDPRCCVGRQLFSIPRVTAVISAPLRFYPHIQNDIERFS